MDSHVETQPLLKEPRKVTDYYAAGDNEDGDGKVRGRGGRGGRMGVEGHGRTRNGDEKEGDGEMDGGERWE